MIKRALIISKETGSLYVSKQNTSRNVLTFIIVYYCNILIKQNSG